LIFSTVYPFLRPRQADIEHFLTEFASDDDSQKFANGNARRLFGIDGSRLPSDLDS
jgi:predicted TIM-barrel fold metal-dependent hydrolase